MRRALLQSFLLRHGRVILVMLVVMTMLGLPIGAVTRLGPYRVVTLAMVMVLLIVLLAAWMRWRRERFIREQPLPQFLKRKLRETYPHLQHKDAELVERGLRQFFLACQRSNRKFVAMPSRVVDAMWHEFIVHTQAYKDWCNLALGHFLHHTPAEALGVHADRNDGLRRAWWWACKDEAIDPRQPTRLPLLFALDTKLGIANGFHYLPDCHNGTPGRDDSGGVHCGTSFSDGSASGDGDEFGGSDGAGGDGGDGGCGGGGD